MSLDTETKSVSLYHRILILFSKYEDLLISHIYCNIYIYRKLQILISKLKFY